MVEFRITSKIRDRSCLSLALMPIIIFCGIMAFIFVSISLFRAYSNYSAINSAIPQNPSVINLKMLPIEKQHLELAIVNFVVISLCLVIPVTLLGIYTTVIQIANIQYSRILIEPEYLHWIYPGGKIVTKWENLKVVSGENKSIFSLGRQIYIELKEPTRPIKAWYILHIFSRKVTKIPIFLFLENWDTEIGKQILQKAPWILPV